MLRRCMTPNPHSKAKYLSELVEGSEICRKEGQKINYDSFFYIDKLTNNKIQLGAAKDIYAQREKRAMPQPVAQTRPRKAAQQSCRQKEYSQMKEMEEINDCFSIMKSTKLFQMENLKNKLFRAGEETDSKEHLQIDCMIKKKKKIREFIEGHLNALCLQEFRKYMEPTGRERVKLINPSLLNIHKAMSNKISKHNIEKIIEEFFQSENGEAQRRPPVNIFLEDIDFPDESRLKELLIHRMLIKNKEFEHLVTPDRLKQIYRQIHSNAQENGRPPAHFEQEKNLGGYEFHEFEEGAVPMIEKGKKKKWKAPNRKVELKKKELLLAIEGGSVYDFLFLIIRWPSLLHYRDELGNNLLHMAGKQNQA